MIATIAVLFAPAIILRDSAAGAEPAKLKVVTTLPDYASFARRIGGDRVTVQHIVKGDQDAHFIRPKPSFAAMVSDADVLIATGLDLELWLPSVVDKSGNRRVRSEEPGYVAVSQGMRLMEKPTSLSRAQGGVHIHGNPHLTCSPINMKVAARNIGAGLIKNDPEGKEIFEKNLKILLKEFDERLFGKELVRLLGGETLCKLAEKGKLEGFLAEHDYKGKPLSQNAGGWWKEMAPLRGVRIVTYHKNWVYFLRIFGIVEAGTVEPRPGIPPSPRHVAELVEMMKKEGIKIILSANYFSESKARGVAEKTGAEPVIVPLYVGGAEGVDDYFRLFEHWVKNLLAAARKTGLLKQ